MDVKKKEVQHVQVRALPEPFIFLYPTVKDAQKGSKWGTVEGEKYGGAAQFSFCQRQSLNINSCL